MTAEEAKQKTVEGIIRQIYAAIEQAGADGKSAMDFAWKSQVRADIECDVRDALQSKGFRVYPLTGGIAIRW